MNTGVKMQAHFPPVMENVRLSGGPRMNSFSFVVFGDMQNHNNVTRHMIALAASMQPDLCVVLGDLVNDGTDLALWEKCINLLEPLSTVSEVVVLPGNHDYERQGVARNFCKFFRTPGDPTYHSLTRGGCRLLLLDTIMCSGEPLAGGALPSNSSQLAWLRSELHDARVRDEPSFVFAHHPIFMPAQMYYSTSPTIRVDESSNATSLGNLLPVLLQGGAHTFFAGHIHLYERSRYREMNFVTSGAAGCPFPNLGDGGNGFSILRRKTNHLCRIELHGDAVRCQAVDERSEVIDEWEEPCQSLMNREQIRSENRDAVPEA